MTIHILRQMMKQAGYNYFTLRHSKLCGYEIKVGERLNVNGKPAFWEVIDRLGIATTGGDSYRYCIKPVGLNPEDFVDHDLTKMQLDGILEDRAEYKDYFNKSMLRSRV